MVAPESDQDENCHISNIAYVRWIQEATRAHSEAVGWTQERYQMVGCTFVIRRHEIDYVRPAAGGEVIKILTWAEAFRPASGTRCTRILRAKDDSELVRATTEWVWVTVDGQRPKRIPPEVQQAFLGPIPS